MCAFLQQEGGDKYLLLDAGEETWQERDEAGPAEEGDELDFLRFDAEEDEELAPRFLNFDDEDEDEEPAPRRLNFGDEELAPRFLNFDDGEGGEEVATGAANFDDD